MTAKIRQQPRIKGQKRRQHSAAYLEAISQCLEKDMRRYKVTMSFVQASIMAGHYGISEQPDFAEPVERRRLRRVS